MKKRIVSLLLCLVLCAAVLPTFAAAEGKPWDTESDWTPLTDSGTLNSGNYYLNGDIEVATGYALEVPAGATVTLDLNGHTVRCSKETGGGAIKVGKGGNLTIQDSAGGGMADGYNTVSLENGCTLTLKSGTIKGNGNLGVIGNPNFGKDQYGNCTVYLQGGVVDGGKGIAIGLAGKAEHDTSNAIYADGGEVRGSIQPEHNSEQYSIYIYHTGNPGTTVFYGKVQTDCDIQGGIFYGDIQMMAGTLSGGTFYGTVELRAFDSGGQRAEVDNTNKKIVNNGVFCFFEYENSNGFSQEYLESLNFDGHGYIQWYHWADGYIDTYYTNDGETVIKEGSTGTKIEDSDKVTVTFDLNGGSFGEDADLFPAYKKGYYAKNGGNIIKDADGNVTGVKVIKGLPVPAPIEPTTDGLEFAGWYNGETKWSFETNAVTDNITLTAKWEEPKKDPEEEPDDEPEEEEKPNTDGLGGLIAILDDVPFVDVSANHYFYDAVKWAYHEGVTGGTDSWHFSPDAGCTRAQIVTFLWRAAGCPSATYLSNFSDVDADAYYATAVAWAVENGITNGTSATTFSPEAVCTRADAVTFLYRAFGKNPNYTKNFSDVPANAYFADAVAWAAENGITGGTGGGKFSPNDTCSRAQIVTFLYRTLG